MASEIKVIKIVDSGCDRYKISSDCCCLGRQWDNYAEKIQVIVPEREVGNACTMIVSADGEVIDHIQVTSEPKDITNVLSRHQFVEISFFFTNETEYLKNTEIKQFYFAKARKPEDFVAEEPEQTGKIDLLLNKGFVKAELDGDIIKFFNSDNEVVNEIEIKGIGGGITEETDPTVPQYVKEIKETDIENWNNKVDDTDIQDFVTNAELESRGYIDNTTNNLVNYYLKQETYTRDEVNELIATINGLSKSIVDTLPNENIDENTIYLVPKTSGSGNDYYDEYLYINGNFEHIGSTQVDLTDYATTEQVNALNTKVDNVINNSLLISEPLNYGFNAGKNARGNGVSIGYNANVTNYGVSIGSNTSTGRGVSIGYNAKSVGSGTAVGDGSNSSFGGTALGSSAKAIATDAVQLGTGTNNIDKSLQILDKNIYRADTDTLIAENIGDRTNSIKVSDIATKSQIPAIVLTELGDGSYSLDINTNTEV